MKVLFCGLGSIGCRHIRNLSAVLEKRGIELSIDAWRSSERALPGDVSELLSNSFSSADELPDGYDVVFITNPTSLHEETIRAVSAKTEALFIEKPVFASSQVNVDGLLLNDRCVCYVACPLRHTPVYKRLREIVTHNRVIAARAICSSYLPEWRKTGDYRTCYSARKELGGGVTLDLIHEWDYLFGLFGEPKETKRFCGRYSPLEITSDDVAVYIARFDNMLLSLHLDYVGRKSARSVELFCDSDVIEGDFAGNRIIYKSTNRVEQLEKEDFYVNEMNYFVDCVLEGRHRNMNDIETALRVLKTALCEG